MKELHPDVKIVQSRLRLEQHFLREERKDLLQERSRLGSFKGKSRTPADRAERTRLEAAIKELETRIASNVQVLRKRAS